MTRREADLASLEAKKCRLADLTALSTITVTFVGRDASTADRGRGGPDRVPGGPAGRLDGLPRLDGRAAHRARGAAALAAGSSGCPSRRWWCCCVGGADGVRPAAGGTGRRGPSAGSYRTAASARNAVCTMTRTP